MQHVSCNWEILINFGLSYEKHCYFLWFWVGLLMSFKFPMISPWLSRAWVVSIGLCRRRGNLFGFFDGTTWALCCARVCQLHPKAVPCMEFHFARYGCSYVRWIVILLSIFWKGLLCYHFEQRIIPWGAFIVCHPNKMIFLKFNAKYDDSFVGWQTRFFFNLPCLHMESKQWQLGKAEDSCQPMFQSVVAEPFTSLQQFYEFLW